MRIEGRGLIGTRLRKPPNLLLYLFIAIQYIVLLSLIHQAAQEHSLRFKTPVLAILYLGPLAVGFCFRQRIVSLSRNGLLSAEIANVCFDWITCMLLVVYGILLEFRALS